MTKLNRRIQRAIIRNQRYQPRNFREMRFLLTQHYNVPRQYFPKVELMDLWSDLQVSTRLGAKYENDYFSIGILGHAWVFKRHSNAPLSRFHVWFKENVELNRFLRELKRLDGIHTHIDFSAERLKTKAVIDSFEDFEEMFMNLFKEFELMDPEYTSLKGPKYWSRTREWVIAQSTEDIKQELHYDHQHGRGFNCELDRSRAEW